jgi:calcium-dependent protein kinase
MKLDSDGDGCVTADELKAGLKQIQSLSEETVQQILSGYDYNGNGAVDYTEFLAATLDTKHFNEDQTCWLAFSKFDTNGDGKLSTKEIAQVIKDEPEVRKILPGDDSAVDNIMKELDTTEDGFIDFQEFLAMMRQKKG